jgi:hypothetical protein
MTGNGRLLSRSIRNEFAPQIAGGDLEALEQQAASDIGPKV